MHSIERPLRAQLRDHVNTVHRKVRAYNCDKCDYNTGFRSNLLQHQAKPHLVCEYCHTFVTVGKTVMSRHVKVGCADGALENASHPSGDSDLTTPCIF